MTHGVEGRAFAVMARVIDGGTSPESERAFSDFETESGDSPHPCSGRSRCICREFNDPKFLDRLHEHAHVSFRWRTFWKELLYHTFFPLTLPLVYLWEGGQRGIKNRQFLGGSLILTLSQWFLAAAFFSLNGLSWLYVSPDIFIADFLWIVRCLILATKYGFTSDHEMEIMRKEVIPLEAQKDRTLMLGWTNVIPLRVLKRQLLLAAVRKNALRCNASLRLIPGASDKTVHEIMQQLTEAPKINDHKELKIAPSWDSLDRAIGFDETTHLCATCLKETGSNKSFETRWLEICMRDMLNNPELIVPTEALLAEKEVASESVDDREHEKACPALDLPALLLAAYILQRASELLPKKQFLHQLFVNPWRLYYLSVLFGIIHAIIPFATRALVGQPSTFGGTQWYNFVVSASSFAINVSSMSWSVNFMLGGLADFRRRYFVARLLNTLLKDGFSSDESVVSRKLRDTKRSIKRNSPYHLGLAINFSDPRSVIGWWAVRTLVQDFGLVFYMRVKYYATYFALYCGLLMGYLVVKLFASNAISTSYILAVVVFDLLVFIGLLCLVVSPGGGTNNLNVEHGATLYRIKMSISTRLNRGGDDLKFEERRSMELAMEVLQSITQAVYWDNLVNQITFLGFTAGAEILGVLIGAGGTAVGIAAQQLTATIS
ncbi:hypothetical protein MARPO_0001s0433 [Marchantia polymorpha]|uniref:Uncharacterized protein n=1 Tax=Marchantia polymorpha TaxID=3197 RepID=A0A2R6XWJ5_MARPO|nr:hypothetical protein MARPO_0001s0433 [Marchantia polymorpha]PTQ50476.1 hypothetical protein MARPO_0001s0433 [Marchantia polymorpha]|eukprot:PTQ50475.1 hypothetical protein MARPO_0001s0433 [Marchantia polymorpha]